MMLYVTLLGVNQSKAVVTHLVHEAVEQHRGASLVYTELSLWCEVVRFLDMLALLRTSPDPNHPQKLVDI